jgi:phosphohistidine phosphatase
MKTLLLVRHAKSSWDDPRLADFERPLNGRGFKAAPFMGELLKTKKLDPSMIVSSPATRARQTAELFRDAGQFQVDITFDGRIYEASPRALREVASELPDAVNEVMLVGHNPGMEGFIRYLTGQLEPMPTAAAAVIDLGVERWEDVDDGCGSLRTIFRPRDLMK